MAHMNPRRDFASLDAILDAGNADDAFLAAVAREMQRTAARLAAITLRRGRRAPMVSLQLAAFSYAHLVASAVRRARCGNCRSGHGRPHLAPATVQAAPCERALEAALSGDPGGAIEQLHGLLRDKRIARIVGELEMGSPAVAVDRLESLLNELTAEAV